eukprot:759560-Hanusia_phi.AAC.1
MPGSRAGHGQLEGRDKRDGPAAPPGRDPATVPGCQEPRRDHGSSDGQGQGMGRAREGWEGSSDGRDRGDGSPGGIIRFRIRAKFGLYHKKGLKTLLRGVFKS